MKKILSLLIVALLLLPLFSFDNGSLLNHPMPLLPNKTLDGRTIDADFYKGHVTIVSFMSIGCYPCEMEIGFLNRIKDEYASNDKLQLLCVARQMRDQMMQFNSDDKKSYYSLSRSVMKVEKIRYLIQPACDDAKSKSVIDSTGGIINVHLKDEYNTLEERFGVTAVPVTMFIDKKGNVRKIEAGGPESSSAVWFYDKLKAEIDALLAE